MTVHVGQITSEVRSAAPAAASAVPDEESSVWDERLRIAALLERVAKDRRRTATGVADD